jgi:hypothetical protein
MEKGTYWNVKDLLGDLLGATAEAVPPPRNEIWASDLGKPYVDRWLQMKGTPYSNPPTGKTLMSFFLGRQIEQGFVQMLVRCGVSVCTEERLVLQERGYLPVVGKPDLVVQVPDWEKVLEKAHAQRAVTSTEHPDDVFPSPGLREILERWRARAPEGLAPMVVEIKSLNSMAFKYHRGVDGFANAYPHHRLQLYTYLRGLGLAEGHLVYIARDTGWVEEVIVRKNEELEEAWLEDVAAISRYYLGDECPPLEPKQVDGKDNWRVAYSRYRDYLYQEVPHGAFAF